MPLTLSIRPFTYHHQIAETAIGNFSTFLDLGMKYDLVFGYFGWIGIDLDICFDVLRFSVMVCRFQILMLFVLLWICLFNLGKG